MERMEDILSGHNIMIPLMTGTYGTISMEYMKKEKSD